jgi:hypothetical protein
LLKHRNGAKLVKKDNKLIAELQQKDLFAIRLGVLKFEGWTNTGLPTSFGLLCLPTNLTDTTKIIHNFLI